MKKIILIISLVISLTHITNAQCIDPTATISHSYNGAILNSFDIIVTNHSSSVQYYVYTYYLNGLVVNSINSTLPQINIPIQTNGMGHLHEIGIQAFCWGGNNSSEEIITPVDIATVADVSGFYYGMDTTEYKEGLLKICNSHYTLTFIYELELYVKTTCFCSELEEVYTIYTVPTESYFEHFGFVPEEYIIGYFWEYLIHKSSCRSREIANKKETSSNLSSLEESSNLTSFPNPLHKGQVVTLSNDVMEVALLNIAGEICYIDQSSSIVHNFTIPSNIPNGIYFMILKGNEKYSYQKVIIE